MSSSVAIIAAAAEGAVAAREGKPFVDARLMEVPRTVRRPTQEDYRSVAPELGARFRSALQERGLDTMRAFPLREGCMGLLVPPPYKEPGACGEPAAVLVFDLPEPGGTPGAWKVPMVALGYTTHGFVIRVMEVLVEESEEGPRYVNERGLFTFE